MPAGLVHTVSASSEAAAPPAYALPRPLPEFSCSMKPAAKAWPAPSASASPATAMAIRVRMKGVVMASVSLLALDDARPGRGALRRKLVFLRATGDLGASAPL